MKKKRNTRLTAKDVIVTLLCLAGVGAAVFLFYKDINMTLSNENSEPIGEIHFKENTVQRRLQGRNLWERLKVSSPIYDGDRIRTGDLSEATAKFKSGNEIEIHENTLIQIDFKKDNTLHFMNGSISVVSSDDAEGFSIKTGDKVVNLAENTTAVLTVPDKREAYQNKDNKIVQEATVAVTSGQAKIYTAPAEESGIRKAAKNVARTVTGIEAPAPQIEQVVRAGDYATFEAEVLPEPKEQADSTAPASKLAQKVRQNVRSLVTPDRAEPNDSGNGNQNNNTAFIQNESDEISQEELLAIAKENTKKKQENQFKVLMPSDYYVITQNQKIKEPVPFFWSNYDNIKLLVSFNSSFNEIIDTEYLSSPTRKGSVVFNFARPGDVIYWCALPEKENFNSNKKYPSGKRSHR